MASRLQFLLQLQDRLSGVAGRATSTLHRLDAALGRVAARAGSGALDAAASGLSVLATGAAAATVAVTGLAAAFGRGVLDAAAFRETTLQTLEVFSGSRENALRLFGQGQRLAAATPFSMREVMGAQTQLISQGFNEQELNPLVAFVSDLASARGDSSVMRDVVNQLGQVQSIGRLQWEDLKQIAQRSGLSVSGVHDEIARLMNLGTGEAGRNAAQAAMRNHRVNAQTGIRAMLDAFARQQGGPLGTLSERQSQTLSGLWSTLKDVPETLLQSIDFERIPGIETLRRSMSTIIRLMDQAGPRGMRLQRVLRDLVDGSFGALLAGVDDNSIAGWLDAGITRLEQMAPLVTTTLAGIRGFSEGFAQGVGPALGEIATRLGIIGTTNAAEKMREFGVAVGQSLGSLLTVAEALGTLVRGLEAVGTWIGNRAAAGHAGEGMGGALGDYIFNRLNPTHDIALAQGGLGIESATNMRGMGTRVAEGLAQGMRDGAPTVAAAGAHLAAVADQSTRQGLEVQSPSRVFEEIGRYTAEGFSLGVDRNIGVARGSLASMTQAPNTTARAGNGAPITVTIIVDGARDPSAVGDDVFQRFSEVQQLAQPEMS